MCIGAELVKWYSFLSLTRHPGILVKRSEIDRLVG